VNNEERESVDELIEAGDGNATGWEWDLKFIEDRAVVDAG
jgi:hypothetical protein